MPTSSKPKPRKTGRPKELDPNTLLDAAESLFAEKGYTATTTRELAKRAKCNIALISYHFGSKEGLYQALLVRYFEQVRNRYTGAERPDSVLKNEWPELRDPVQRKFCAAMFELFRDKTIESPMQKILSREMLTGATQMAAAIKRSEGGAYQLVLQLLTELQKNGKIRAGVDLRFCVISLIGPVIYSCVAAPLVREVYGFKDFDQKYVRELCLHQTRIFFEGCSAL